jgi:hypothetical protein
MFSRRRMFFVLGLIGIVFPVFAQKQNVAQIDMILANETGETITEIEIKPSKAKYKNNKNVYAIQNISVFNKSSIGIDLPPLMKTMDSFDIVLKYGKKNAKTKKVLP